MSQQPDLFDELRRLAREDGRFALQAYVFLYQSLERAQKLVDARRHVTGQELLEGFRHLAVESFGPLALMVLHAWGLRRTEDLGIMVFLLVDRGLMGKTDEDSLGDFVDVYAFEQAFDPERLLGDVDASVLKPPYGIVARELPKGARAQRAEQGLPGVG